jgi:hypothetical protein
LILTRAAVSAGGEKEYESLVITMQYSRQHIASTLRKTGFFEVADEALRVLPDPVDEDQIAAFLAPHAITMDELVSRMGAEM